MVPLGTRFNLEKRLGPQIIPRYNLYPSATINGESAPGYSSGQALKLMDQMAERKLPASMDHARRTRIRSEKLRKVAAKRVHNPLQHRQRRHHPAALDLGNHAFRAVDLGGEFAH